MPRHTTVADEREHQPTLSLRGRHVRRDASAEVQRRDLREAVGHELRTPLTVILGFADLMLDDAAGSLTAGQREAVTAIREAALRELGVVEEVEALLRGLD
jgi:Amt family ammonium transporter